MLRKVLKIRYIVLIPRKMSLSRFSVFSEFSNMLYGKKRKHGNAENKQFWLTNAKKPPICYLSLIPRKISLWKFFVISVFLNMLFQKRGKSTKKFLNKKANGYHC